MACSSIPVSKKSPNRWLYFLSQCRDDRIYLFECWADKALAQPTALTLTHLRFPEPKLPGNMGDPRFGICGPRFIDSSTS